jgi:hypothetical protein
MTLLAEVQAVMERTYRPAGVNLEECLIPQARSRELAARAVEGAALSREGCTFLRLHEGNLHIAIYYDPALIGVLEAEDPRESLSHRNIRALIVFLEEITHGLHAALAFDEGRRRWDSESFACALEAQARVDVYYLLLRFIRLLGGRVDAESRQWVRSVLFEGERIPQRGRLRRRYARALRIARQFTEQTDRMPSDQRVGAIRAFRACSLRQKARWARGHN